jgi:hypothetical protein
LHHCETFYNIATYLKETEENYFNKLKVMKISNTILNIEALVWDAVEAVEMDDLYLGSSDNE